MFRALSRLGALGAVLAAALALSGTALANPTTPQLNPIPPTVFGSPVTVSWSPSAFDAGSILKFYELQVLDITAGTSYKQAVFGTSKSVPVAAGHTYGVRVRAANLANGQLLYSGSSADVFHVLPFLHIPIFYEVFYPWPIDPCWSCPPWELFRGDDPVVQHARELVSSARVLDREVLAGLYVDARGAVSVVQR